MRIAITGGTGFIGRHLATELILNGSPKLNFTDEQIRKGLPEPGRFTVRDLRCCHV